jgi:hypothetical protein
MHNNFIELISLLAAMSLLSWAVVGLTLVIRFLVLLRYRLRGMKSLPMTGEYQA